MKLRTFLTGSAAIIALTAAGAANAAGHYISFFGGYATMDSDFEFFTSKYNGYANVTGSGGKYSDTRTRIYQRKYTAQWRTGFDGGGFVVGGALGRDLVNDVRIEIETAYRKFDLEDHTWMQGYGRFWYGYAHHKYGLSSSRSSTVTTRFRIDNEGDASVWSFLVNVWYDIDLPNTHVTPFIGGGIGLAHLSLDYRARVVASFSTTGTLSNVYGGAISSQFDESDWVFAYQFGAGLAYALGNGPLLTAQYRYFGTEDADVGATELDVESHNFLVGLTIPF